MDASSYMIKTEGEDNKIEETEDLEGLEERAFAAEQSQEHTGGKSNKHLKLTRKNLRCWKQPSIYAWPIENSGLKEINDVRLLILNDLANSVYNFITTIQIEGNGLGSANRS